MLKDMNIKETINEIENLSKLLRESYVFDDNDSDFSYEEDEQVIDEPIKDEVKSCDNISQIRSLALNGIQDFAENVESEEYQFYKKVWLLCDKFCETDKSSTSVE